MDIGGWLRSLVERLTEQHEADRTNRWKVGDAPADYIDKQVAAIVGLEIPIARLIGKWKVSQNRPAQDRQAVVTALENQGGEASAAMADLVRRYGDK